MKKYSTLNLQIIIQLIYSVNIKYLQITDTIVRQYEEIKRKKREIRN